MSAPSPITVLGLAGLVLTAPVSRAAPAGAREAGTAIVVFENERLSVHAENVLLRMLLDEISQRCRVAVNAERGAGRERVSVHFDALPLHEGLRQVLKDHDAFFFYGAEREKPASLRTVWVYPRSRTRGIVPTPPEAWASTAELEGTLTDPDPETRARAFEALIERKRGQAVALVLQALEDTNRRVGVRVLYKGLQAHVKLPAETLARLAVDDSSPQIRFLALEALGRHPAVVEPIATRALNDPVPYVRKKAQEILRDVNKMAQRAKALGAQPPGRLGE